MHDLRLSPYGERALFVDAGEPDLALQRRIVRFADSMRRSDGVVDAVAGLGSCTIFLDDTAALERVSAVVQTAWDASDVVTPGPLVDIPVRYGAEFGEDFHAVCERCSLSDRELIDLHSETEYAVLFVGYRPGFAYLGDVDERLRVPRLAVPRSRVPARSLAIAGRMTSIYPMEAPGGWNLIGTALVDLFDIARATPSLLQAGMRVRFVSQ